MKKSLIFIMPHLEIGGAEKALTGILNNIDYSAFEVDLLVLNPFSNIKITIPQEVNVISSKKLMDLWVQSYFKTKSQVLAQLFSRKDFFKLLRRLLFRFRLLLESGKNGNQLLWGEIENGIMAVEKRYAVAISYVNGLPLYFTIDKINAEKKICFIHFDYARMDVGNYDLELSYFQKYVKIICVSNACKESFDIRFPSCSLKTSVFENIVDSKEIINLSNHPIGNDPFAKVLSSDRIKIVSVARLDYIKGIDLAIEACDILNKKFDITWIVIGEGKEKAKLEKLIKRYGLENIFILIGKRNNPYPWVRNSQIFVQPSRSEGKSIAITEAAILGKYIVATKNPSIFEQLGNYEHSCIVDSNPTSIAAGIENMIKIL